MYYIAVNPDCNEDDEHVNLKRFDTIESALDYAKEQSQRFGGSFVILKEVKSVLTNRIVTYDYVVKDIV